MKTVNIKYIRGTISQSLALDICYERCKTVYEVMYLYIWPSYAGYPV